VGNFDEHKWGISVSAINAYIPMSVRPAVHRERTV